MTGQIEAVALGLMLGVGLLLLLVGATASPRPPRRVSAWTTLAQEAGLPHVRLAHGGLACAGAGLVGGVLMWALSASLVIAVAAAVLAAVAPVAWLRRRRSRRRTALRAVWPDVVDDLASAVRAGLSLAEAIEQLSLRGPEPLRPAFRAFGDEYRASGRFGVALDLLKDSLADPVGDRVVEALRVARDVGGSDLGRLLRTLATFLRDDARTRGELESRQSWTVNAARLAVAAPWLVLLLLATRPQAVAAYDTPAGALVLAGGAVACLVAYRLMVRLGRLPDDVRVLR